MTATMAIGAKLRPDAGTSMSEKNDQSHNAMQARRASRNGAP